MFWLLSYCLNFSKQNLAKCFQAQLSYFPISSYISKHEIFQAERGSPQLAEIPLANYRTAPELTKQNTPNNSKQNYRNIRTCQTQQRRKRLKKSKHNYRT